jgi:hypothetical protein
MAALSWFLMGCGTQPEGYPPPEQREPLTAGEASEAKAFVAMNDAGAESYFVKDIRGLEGGQWRWTGPEPTLHFVLDKVENWKILIDFAVAGATFKDTGPVNVTVHVNDHLAAEEHYEEFGKKHIEEPVDPAWISAGGDTIVKMTVEPAWVSPNNTRLGVILVRAGFVER